MCAVVTLGLIGLGGLVTSKQAGMAVPDWPTSYGYNMFWLPIDQWVGGIFYEHTHRLLAAFTGLLTSILAAWLWGRETTGRARWLGWGTIFLLVMMLGHRGTGNTSGGAAGVPLHFKVLAVVMPVLVIFGVVQCVRHRGALCWLGLTAFFAVIFQGILGGLRVALYKDELGIFHGLLAQAFFVLLCGIAWVTSRRWKALAGSNADSAHRVGRMFALVSGLILLQLVLGASMRHQHAGLAVPDFPLAYGKLWPATDAASIETYNHRRSDVREFELITAWQIHLHMAHRIMALVILITVLRCAWRLGKPAGIAPVLRRGAKVWAGLIIGQALLGAATVWSNKAADLATLHVVLGALSLMWGAMLTLTACQMERLVAGRRAGNKLGSENEVAGRGQPAIQGA